MLELLALAIAPALFILLYIYRKDSSDPEPLHLVAWVFFLGALSVIPAAIAELPFPEGVFSSAVVAPVVEESVKFLVVFLAVYRHPAFNEPMDGIVYATAAGLGFATIENILYVLEGGIAVGIIRAVASVPGHVVFSCIWGFALGTAKFRPERMRGAMILAGLLGAMLLHGIFNFSLEVFDVLGLLFILIVIIPFGWWMTCRNIRCAQGDPASACTAMRGQSSIPDNFPREENSSTIPHGNSVDPERTGPDEGSHPGSHRFCIYCGAPNPGKNRFCENCGRAF